jgi:hypothetical protein
MRKVMLLLLAVVMAMCPVLVSCDSSENGQSTAPASGPTEPTVGYIPEGWNVSARYPYGTYWEEDGTRWGLVEYMDESDWDSVAIYYGDVPPELKGNETDGDTLMTKAADCLAPIEPSELGMMSIGGHVAGYARAYDDEHDWCDTEIVFVMDSTCIDICARYGTAYSEDEMEAASLINSIH